MKLKNSVFLTCLMLFVLVLSFGCKKKKVDTIALVYVKDASNNFVPNARVILYGKSTLEVPKEVVLYDTAYTNESGEASFNFNDVYQSGQAGVAVLNIDASKGTAFGQGIIKVEQEKTSTETVFVQ